MSFYSFNTHAQGVKDPTKLLAHIRKTTPAWHLVMDGLGLAEQIKAVSPSTNVIHRNHGVTGGDDDVFAKVSPERWLELRSKEADSGVWLMTTCEPGWGADVIAWHVRLMELCIPRKIRLVVGNWSVGTPDPALIPMARKLFEMLDAHRDLFVLGLHEYANAVITSGFVGGAPDGYTESHDKQHHPDYQKPSTWPLNGEARILTKWHMGRYQFINDYCKAIGINPPRIVLTETGFDDVSDVKFWSNKLPRTSPYTDIRGYKTLAAYWKQIAPEWSHDRAYFEQLRYAENNIYAGSNVEGGLIYCYGHIDPKWQPFDLEGRTEFLELMEAYAVAKPTTKPFITPVPMPTDAAGSIRIRVKNVQINVRSGNGTEYQDAGDLKAGQEVTLYRFPVKRDTQGLNWQWVDITDKLGGWVCTSVLQFERVEPPIVVDVPPVSDPVTPSVPYPEIRATYAREMAKVYRSLATSYHAMATDSETTAAQWEKLANVIEDKAA